MKTTVRIAAGVFSLVLLALGASTAFAAGTIDQHAEPGFINAGFVEHSTPMAQTFTPSVSGTLDQVMLRLGVDGDPGTLNIDIFATSAGVPTGSSLASATFPSSTPGLSGSYTNFEIVFATPAQLVVGTQYAIVLTAPNAIAQTIPMPFWNPATSTTEIMYYTIEKKYMWSFGADQAAAGTKVTGSGSSWTVSGGEDFYFATYMTEPAPETEPEPGTSSGGSGNGTGENPTTVSTSSNLQLANTGSAETTLIPLTASIVLIFGTALLLRASRR